MKKSIFSLFIVLLSFLLFTGSIAAQTYRRGFVKVFSYIYGSPGGSILLTPSGNYTWLTAPELVEIVGESGNYYQIKFLYSGYTKTGYILKSNVQEQVYTVDENYKQEMINKGFPGDYAEKLAILHAIHPNWVFTPSFTGKVSGGIDFSAAVSGEASVIDRNLIQTKDTTLLSTAPGAYANGVWIGFSGGSWYAVSEQTIAYFLDPRNFMNETNFFMFENQGYNPDVQYRPMVEKALVDTFMTNPSRNPFYCGGSSKSCIEGPHYYVDTIVDAGAKNGVNPVHLASRIKKEQGNGSSPLALGTGWNGQYVGYFNFFNISANGTTEADVILNGLRYAYNKGWDNQYISIVEGTGLIGNEYVGVGQSTAYYQKFNTINLVYSHQYMQNILAPYDEGYSAYISYYNTYTSLAEWDSATYEFLIPVYQNMPVMTSLDASYNADATLQSLSVSNCNFNPTFESGIKSYDCYTAMSTTEVTVSANATSASAKVEYQSKLTLSANDTTTQIKVTAGNGNVELYEVRIHRIETDGYSPSEVLNGVGIKVSNSYASNFADIVTVSGLVNAVKGNYYFADVKVTNVDGSTKAQEDAIKTGDIITVTNSGLTESYSAVLYGDPSGDGIIDIRDLLLVQQHIVKARVLSGANYNAADVNKDGEVNIVDLLLVKKHIEKQYTIGQG